MDRSIYNSKIFDIVAFLSKIAVFAVEAIAKQLVEGVDGVNDLISVLRPTGRKQNQLPVLR